MIAGPSCKPATSLDVVCFLVARSYRFAGESALHDLLEDLLAESTNYHVQREVVIDGGRIDLLVDRVGIEVKVGGTTADVCRQLRRYVASRQIDELVLVTNRARHLHELRLETFSKPVRILNIAKWSGL